MRWARWIGAVFLLAALLALSGGVWALAYLSTPMGEPAGRVVTVEIPEGEGAAQVARRLEMQGVIDRAWLFTRWMSWQGIQTKVQAGRYDFELPIAPVEVMRILATGRVALVEFTLPEGLTLFESARVIAEAGLGEREALETAFRDPAAIRDLDVGARTLEGYLFPNTYRMSRGLSAEEVARTLVETFRTEVFEPRRQAVAESGFDLGALVTLASLVEKETARADERATVAGVYLNRLRKNMLLQCDPTVIYARIIEGTWDGNIRRKDLSWDHPYNTYVRRGLPPGPIASPGTAAFDAVLHPAETSALFFVSRGDGSHVFSETYAEHRKAVRRYQGGR